MRERVSMGQMTMHEFRTAVVDTHDRGRALGTQFRSQISTCLDEYQQFFRTLGATDDVIADFGRRTIDRIDEWSPYLAAEIRGTAEGADVGVEALTALNARTEMLANLHVPSHECSTGVYLPVAEPPRTLQTWDWLEGLSREALLVEAPRDAGGRVLFFTEFGMVGKIGVASSGLGVHFNILNHETDGRGAGVPVHVIARRILDEATDIDHAVDLARSAVVTASSVITVSSWRDGVAAAVCIELSPAGVAVVPGVSDAALIHTNSFVDEQLAAGDRMPEYSLTRERAAFLERMADALRESAPEQRASALAVDPVTGEPSVLCMAPAASDPFELRYRTKLTIALDLRAQALHYVTGPPAALAPAAWRTFA